MTDQNTHTIEFETKANDTTWYEFEVSDQIVGSTSIETGDSVQASSASGRVFARGRKDSYTYTGDLVSLQVNGRATVRIDGTVIRGAPRSYTYLENAGKTADIAIYESDDLVRSNGRAPGDMAALFVANALKDRGYNYDITYNLMSRMPPSEDPHEAFDWWHGEYTGAPIVSKDANLLLVNSNGGGETAGRLYETASVASAANIDEHRAWSPSGSDNWHRNMHAVLHEVGHALGARHDHDDDKDGNQHPGFGWNQDGYWHRTPTAAGNGVENACGEYVEKKQSNLIMRHQTFHDCTDEYFEIY